jgi:hypothetical protein
MKELEFENTLRHADGGYIDGPCKLPSHLDWPVGSDSSPLFHLLSVPLLWLNPNQDSKFLTARWVSVFICYDKTGYTHYGKMSSDQPDHIDAIVILHDMSGSERSMHPSQAATSKNVKLIAATEGDDNVASYVDSVPAWVQDPIDLVGYKWVLSVYGPDMDASLGENRGILSDGVGYVFLKSNFDIDLFGPVGKFFFQL